ncbi:MAG TPA: HAMP domain-containing sensor histidine kinase [Candidatus Limnocylindria bacterium]|nr:HAMP domain-containing sensor histidine kinase [Candidatus Limnocylindria bacterium]
MRRRFVRRAAGFALLLLLLLVFAFLGVAWLLGTLIGQQVLTAVLPILGFVIGLLLLVRILLGMWRQALPLSDLIEASERVEAGQIGTQVRVRGPREVRSLARAFNAMSARLAADTADRRRLLADVSHELRTPLSVIQGNVEGMIDGLYPADRAHLERVLAETRQMERLIEDLRTLSLADAGALALHREPVDLRALAGEVVAGFEPQARDAGVELNLDQADADAGTLLLDPRRMRQVIGNLVSNALRHTPSGGRVSVRVAYDGSGSVLLEVTDTGEGMDAETAARAFDRFWRAGDAPGAGLGLAIVRDLVEAHGGEVALESEPGAGTVVRCRLPVEGHGASADGRGVPS